jgi:hypothetical protein
MDELFIYDRDKSLFKAVLQQSIVMEGRYHVSPNSGQDLNSNNLDTLVPSLPGDKYPICVCLTPRSYLKMENGQQKEEFYFTLLFLCQTYTGKNGTKNPDPRTRKSTHEVWYDWKDMKQCASDFIITLDNVTRKKKLANNLPIATEFNIEVEKVDIKRLSRFNEDRLSGVAITFCGNLMGGFCEVKDYLPEAFAAIEIPDQNVHAHHKH